MLNEGYIPVSHKEPSFQYKKDGLNVTRGSAWSGPGCHLGCGVLLYTDDEGKFVRAEGDPENPFNQGRLCTRCLALNECVNNPDRLLYPMKRDPKDRGKDCFERITWDEAYDLIESKMKYYRDEFGPWTVISWNGTGRDIGSYISRFMWSYGSPNVTAAINGIACYAPRVFGCSVTTGSFWVGDYSQQFPDRYDNPNWKCPEVVVIWGNNPVVSNSDGLYGHWIVDVMKRGAKLVVMDPRMTWLANRAECWLRVRPGTDAALALGIANVIIEEDLYDHEFVENWCFGFEEYAERCAEFPPEKVEEICWVPADKIREAARMIAKADGCAIQWGVAVDQTTEALPATMALSDIMMITGNLDRPGGMIKPPELLNYLGGWGYEFLPEENNAYRIGVDEFAFYQAGAVPGAPASSCLRTCFSKKPYELKMAWIQTSDFLTGTGPDPEFARLALSQLEFIVNVDMFMNATTMALADVVLPVTTYPERNGIRIGDGCQRGETINKACEPVGECKSDQEILLELGRRLNPEAWPWETVEDMFSSILEPTGADFHEMQEVAPVYLPYEYYKYKTGKMRPDGQPGFPTQSGKVELYSVPYMMFGMDPLPEYFEPTPSPYSTPEKYEEFPYVIITGARRWNSFHSENRRQKHLRAIHPEPTIEMHPQTAAELGLTEGQWVWVESPRKNKPVAVDESDPKAVAAAKEYEEMEHPARAKRKVEITEALDPRVVCTEHGWSHPEAGAENLFDTDTLNINRLIGWDDMSKIGVGANYKTGLCKIYPCDE